MQVFRLHYSVQSVAIAATVEMNYADRTTRAFRLGSKQKQRLVKCIGKDFLNVFSKVCTACDNDVF